MKLLTWVRLSQSTATDLLMLSVKLYLLLLTDFFSHSIKQYVAYRYQQCHRLAALPAKIFVFNSHMQAPIQ